VRHGSPAPLGRIPTKTYLSEELAGLGTPQFPQVSFTASSHEAPQAAQFRVAVGADGTIRHCFALNSSGDTALDEQARQYLLLTRFTASQETRLQENAGDEADTWGVATIEWGNDLAVPVAPKESSP
jgi:hypothetical protein